MGNSESKRLSDENRDLQGQVATLLAEVQSLRQDEQNPRGISSVAIGQYVDTLLNNDSTNAVLVPDFLERRGYSALIGHLLTVLNNVKIEIFGHNIGFHVSPAPIPVREDPPMIQREDEDADTELSD